MKIMNTTSVIGLAFGAAMLWCAPAQANGETHQCPNGQWVYTPDQCSTPPTNPTQPGNGGNAGAIGVGVGAGTATIGDVGGGSASVGDVGGGNATATNGPNTNTNTNTVTNGPISVTNGPTTSTSGVNNSGNSTNRNNNSATARQQQAQRTNVTNQIDASNNSRYQAAANSVNIGPAVIGGDECKVGGGIGGSTIGQTLGGNFGVIDKSCAVVRMNRNERNDICLMFGPQSRECASVTYHASALGAMAMVESGRVVEKSGPRVGIVPAKRPAAEASLVRAWNNGETTRNATPQRATFRNARGQLVQCPAEAPNLNPATGKCRQ